MGGKKVMKTPLLLINFFMFITLPTLGLTLDDNSLAKNIERELIKKGFENVSVIVEDKRVIVTYENRMYRHNSMRSSVIMMSQWNPK